MKSRLQTIILALMVVLALAGAAQMILKSPPPGEAEVSGIVNVEMKTSEGVIRLELDAERAPQTVANFVQYAEDGFYNDTLFHRVIDGFMIQGGGFDLDFQQKATRDPIINESGNGLKNERGSIAMARLPEPDSATAQFFINLVDNSYLDESRYAVFGRVVEGLEVVDRIAKVDTGSRGPYQDVPLEAVIIESVRVQP